MQAQSFMKLAVGAAMTVAALAGPVTSAKAMTFNTGDAVLIVYGNATEYNVNLSQATGESMAQMLSTGVDFDVSSILSNSAVNGGASGFPLKYALVSYTGTDTTDTFTFGDNTQRSSWTSTNLNAVVGNTIATGLSAYQTAVAGTGTQTLFAQSDAASFSTNMDPAGSGSLGGGVPSTRPAYALLDRTLYLLQREVNGVGSSLTQVGTAFLSSTTGHFVIASPVPVPAAVILFGTGIIGLAGLARRRAMGQA